MRKLLHANSQHCSLDANGKFNTALSFALELYEQNSIYTFIPKNACSTLRYSLAINNGVIDSPSDIDWIDDNNHTFTTDLKGLCKAKYTFVVLRCPFRRLASVYLDKFVNTNHPALVFAKLLKDTNLETITFRDFVLGMKSDAILRADIHWRPQSDFLIYEKYDDYFSVEDFNYAVETLRNKIDFSVIDSRHLIGHDTSALKKVEKYNYSDTPAYELRKMKSIGIVPSYENMYDEDLIAIVNSIYHSDIKLYDKHFSNGRLFVE